MARLRLLTRRLTVAMWLVSSLLPVCNTLAADGTGSYVVLEDGEKPNLVRLSSDGKSVELIAKNVDGVSLAIDHDGNYIVGARKSLLRVTRSGAVAQVAIAPAGSEWTSVAVDKAGNVIVADGTKPKLWRVSADGSTVTEVASYYQDELEQKCCRFTALAVDPSGDYVLLAEGAWYPPGLTPQNPQGVGPTYLYRITPAGQLTEIRMPTNLVKNLSRAKVIEPVQLLPDHDGTYIVLDEIHGLTHLTLEGNLTEFTGSSGRDFEFGGFPGGAARNPESGEIAVASQVFPTWPVSTKGVRVLQMRARAVVWDAEK